MNFKLKKVWVDPHFNSKLVTATYQVWNKDSFIDFQMEDFLECLPKDGEYSRKEVEKTNLPSWVKKSIIE